jgi:hypothetical protein
VDTWNSARFLSAAGTSSRVITTRSMSLFTAFVSRDLANEF